MTVSGSEVFGPCENGLPTTGLCRDESIQPRPDIPITFAFIRVSSYKK